ncbi:GC-rich sequence DNA-binding factor domain-containing protein [Artemisia annua]|uniref:GC-rich sequence DNA-binding factor domain-containing protein n=1 Tax=Artemisia annua TaxID=35608 RepID=A0A2U1L3H3_ARTAN|nr:GC-rich sequence DNA-binding factor domain-containing protein [Artemisia annua]
MSADSSMAEVTMVCMDSSSFISDGGRGLRKAQFEAVELYCREKIKAHPGNLVGLTTLGYYCLYCKPTRDIDLIKSEFKRVEFLGFLQLDHAIWWANHALQSSPLPKRRLVFFAGSELHHTTFSDLEESAAYYTELNISVDVVDFGVQDRFYDGRKHRLLMALAAAAMNGRYLYAPSGSHVSLSENLKSSPIMPRSSLDEETKTVENVDPLGMNKDHHLANSKDQPRKKKNRKQNRLLLATFVIFVHSTLEIGLVYCFLSVCTSASIGCGLYTGGGLGKNAQGIVAPIEAKLRPKNMGMGFNDYKEAANAPALQEEEKKALPQPTGKSKKKRKDYITAEELLVKKQERGLEVVQKVFDMRGPQVRVLTNLDNLNAEEKLKEDDIPMPLCQSSNIIYGDESELGILTIESFAKSFLDLQKLFPDEYKLCSLSTLACSLALPLFLRLFQGWEPLVKPTDHLDVISVWKDLLQGDEIFDSPYTQLFMEFVFPAIRIASTKQARQPEPLFPFRDSWEQLLPHSALQNILDHIVIPKLTAAVNSWDPRRDTIPIHFWVHPWLLGQKLETLYHAIRNRLKSVLHAWHPSDVSAYTILSPWKPVFDPASWEQLMPIRNSISSIGSGRGPLSSLFITCFNKWQEVLYQWLRSKPNFQEVTNWYLGWRDLIPTELLSNEHVRLRLNTGLDMMNQAVEGLEVVQPGVRENISYLKAREQRQFEAQQKAAAQAAKLQMDDMGSMSLKEVIELHAQHDNLLFKPKPGRMVIKYTCLETSA